MLNDYGWVKRADALAFLYPPQCIRRCLHGVPVTIRCERCIAEARYDRVMAMIAIRQTEHGLYDMLYYGLRNKSRPQRGPWVRKGRKKTERFPKER